MGVLCGEGAPRNDSVSISNQEPSAGDGHFSEGVVGSAVGKIVSKVRIYLSGQLDLKHSQGELDISCDCYALL